MTVWRPPQAIRVKALGLMIEDRHLFAAEVLDDGGALKGVRPLGGTVEFGETFEIALRREFQEELGAGIDIVGPVACFENIFTHEGSAGHEIVFAAPIRLLGRTIALGEAITFAEADGAICHARWWPIEGLLRGEPALYPEGLAGRLAGV